MFARCISYPIWTLTNQTVNPNNIFSMLRHVSQKTLWIIETRNYIHKLQSQEKKVKQWKYICWNFYYNTSVNIANKKSMQNYSYVVEIFEKVQPCNHMLIFSTLGAILPFIPNALFSTIIMSYHPFHFLAKMVSLCPMNHYVSIDASRWYKNTI